MIIAIDPGSEESALICWDGERVISRSYEPNAKIRAMLRLWNGQPHACVIEMIGHYGTGMPAGKTVFDTCVWIGRFTEAYGSDHVHTILRPTVKAHICGSARAKDGNVRQAILDRFGGKNVAIGKKASQGPLYGVSGDEWAALAVAITWYDLNITGKKVA